MAGDWIKMRRGLGTDEAVLAMSAKLGIDEFGVVGRLHAVWAWLDHNSKDGTSVRIASAFLDRLTACPGFAEALCAEGWLSGRDGDLSFPNYLRHNGTTAKLRAQGADRQEAYRNAKRNGEDVTSVTDVALPDKRREEEIRKDKKTGTAATPPRPKLTDDEFLEKLRTSPAYQHVDMESELAKMDIWLATPKGARRKKTHQFILNWLNKIERPIKDVEKPKPDTKPEWLRAAEEMRDGLVENEGYAMTDKWRDSLSCYRSRIREGGQSARDWLKENLTPWALGVVRDAWKELA